MIRKFLRVCFLYIGCLGLTRCAGTNEKIAGAALGAVVLAGVIGFASAYNSNTVNTYLNPNS